MTDKKTSERLCIFDWNGTIQDDLHHIYECGVQRIFRHYGLRCPTLDEYRNEVTANFMLFYYAHGIPHEATADSLNAIMAEGFKEKGRSADVFPDAVEAVRTFRSWGFAVAVVSGYAQSKLDLAIQRSGLALDLVRVIGDVRDKNPVYEDLVRDCGASYVVGIGDTVEDAMATLHVGGVAYLCHRGFHTKDRLTDAVRGLDDVTIVDTLLDVVYDLY